MIDLNCRDIIDFMLMKKPTSYLILGCGVLDPYSQILIRKLMNPIHNSKFPKNAITERNHFSSYS